MQNLTLLQVLEKILSFWLKNSGVSHFTYGISPIGVGKVNVTDRIVTNRMLHAWVILIYVRMHGLI